MREESVTVRLPVRVVAEVDRIALFRHFKPGEQPNAHQLGAARRAVIEDALNTVSHERVTISAPCIGTSKDIAEVAAWMEAKEVELTETAPEPVRQAFDYYRTMAEMWDVIKAREAAREAEAEAEEATCH